MPPKSMSQAQKIEKFLTFFHESKTCHTLKDLETSASVATKINKVHIKDLLKELTDTNQVRVEKIGSGNWYWAWPAEELCEKTDLITKLQQEEATIQEAVSKLSSDLDERYSTQASVKTDPGYDEFVSTVTLLEAEVQSLLKERDGWEAAAADVIGSKRSAIVECKGQAALLTDNILALEAYIQRHLPVSREEMEGVRRECYGNLYCDGQDITQLDE